MIDLSQLWRDAYIAQLTRTANPGAARVAANQAVADAQAMCPQPTQIPKPVYRLRNGSQYLYTISPDERDSAIARYNYILEGIAFYAYEAP